MGRRKEKSQLGFARLCETTGRRPLEIFFFGGVLCGTKEAEQTVSLANLLCGRGERQELIICCRHNS